MDDLTFGILIISLAFGVSLVIRAKSIPTGYTGKAPKTWCPPHKWEYNKEGFLQCVECTQKPGYQGRT